MNISIQFLGACGTVTGSNYLVTCGATKLLVDCGLFQGDWENQQRNYQPFAFNPQDIDFMVLTHAHLDHCGRIPKLYREGFRGKIYCTPATADLAKIILTDAAQIQEHGVREDQLDILFNRQDAINAIKLFRKLDYRTEFEINPQVKLCLQDAGHILGSAIAELWLEDKKIVFSGDLGNSPVPILNDPATIPEANYVVCESTYGNRLHTPIVSREEDLQNAAIFAQKHHAQIIIPAFALERTQDLLYTFNLLKNQGRFPNIPVILDSPLATEITAVYKKYTDLFDQDFQAYLKTDPDLFDFPNFRLISTKEESKQLNNLQEAAVIIAGSGMVDAGRVPYHIVHHASNPDNQIIFTGYQVPGTPGRKILDGAKHIELYHEFANIRARVFGIESFSSHADQKGLLTWLNGFKTQPTVLITHGDDDSRQILATKISQQLKFKNHQPQFQETYDLI
ncbi:MAG: MBL fold metallo-hydrolase [Patescibacteria group bacterium]|jgi:metallo-beta-lactamase family protein